MGLFGDLKKVLFGAKSIAKSAAEKAAEKGKDITGDMSEKAGDLFDVAKEKVGDVTEGLTDKMSDMTGGLSDKAGDLFDKTLETAKDATSKVVDFAEDMGEKAKDKADSYFEKKETSNPIVDDVESSVFGTDEDKLDLGEVPSKNIPDFGDDVLSDMNAPKTETPNEFIEGAKGAAEKLGGKVLDTTGKIGSKVMEQSEKLGGKVLEKGGEALDKFKGVSEVVGGKVLEQGGKIFDAFKERAEDVGGDLKDKAGNFFDKAQKAADMGEDAFWEGKDKDIVEQANDEVGDIDDVVEKAKKMAADAQDKVEGFSDKVGYDDLKESLLDDKDDFFSRADKFADGDYSGKGKWEKTDTPKKPNEGSIKGFEDRDGDGDDLIDDAIIED